MAGIYSEPTVAFDGALRHCDDAGHTMVRLRGDGLLGVWRMGSGDRPEVMPGYRRVGCLQTPDGWAVVEVEIPRRPE